jgi:hypothetical protein
MRMIPLDYESLDLFVRMEDCTPEGIYAFQGRDRQGRDRYNDITDLFTQKVIDDIYEHAETKRQEIEQDEREGYYE